jgi:hypothetical protein
MHNNPVKRGLVHSPEEWPWSSSGFYYLNDSSLFSMDKLVWIPSRPQSVAVGTAVTRCPPHRPVRALLTHTVLTSDR